MARTTRTEVVAVFERLAASAGVPIGGKFDPETRSMSRGWSLDYSQFGGYKIAGHSGTGTSESEPMGSYRMPAGEFVRAMHFAIRAIEASRDHAQV